MDYADELQFAKSLAYDAGKIMREYFLSSALVITNKEDNSPVTQADTTINDLIIHRINQTYPSHAVLGEEASSHQESSHVWIVDPIDGTQAFTVGIPTATVSIALAVSSEVKVAVVYEPVTDRLYTAVAGQGAFCNGSPITVSSSTELHGSTISLGSRFRPEQAVVTSGELYDRCVARGARGYHLHSTVFSLMMTASGAAVASMAGRAHIWDIAAGLLIVQEAGGVVTDFENVAITLDHDVYTIVASNGKLHAEALDLLHGEA